MVLHRSSSNRPTYLLLDSAERIAVLPTNFIRALECGPKKRTPKTIKLYAGKIRDFCSFLEGHNVYGQVRLDDAIVAMGLPILDEFYRSCIERGLGETTIRGYEVAVKMFTDWLTTEEAGRAKTHPIYENLHYRTPTPTKRVPRYLLVDGVITLLLGMHWEVQRLITHFIFETGLRVSEVPRVLKSDLPLIEKFPSTQMYFPLFVRGSKGRGGYIKERYTIISRAMLVRINLYHKTRTYFTNHDWPESTKPAFLNSNGNAIKSSAIQKFIADALKRTPLAKASAQRLRHGFAFSVMRSEHGASLQENLIVVQRALGHSHLSTTEIYTHIPAPVLKRITEDSGTGDFHFRFEEAQRVFEATFLPERNHPKLRRIGVRNS